MSGSVQGNGGRLPFERVRNRVFVASDAAAIAFAAFAAFTIRFEGLSWIGTSEGRVAREFLLVALPLKLALFWAFGLYRRLWRTACRTFHFEM